MKKGSVEVFHLWQLKSSAVSSRRNISALTFICATSLIFRVCNGGCFLLLRGEIMALTHR